MSEPKFAHNVYFKLKDDSPDERQRLIAGCRKYLAGEAGIEFFTVGELADTHRNVNDRSFSVALNLLFQDRAAHDAYQNAPDHHTFIRELQDNWEQVRVFDAEC